MLDTTELVDLRMFRFFLQKVCVLYPVVRLIKPTGLSGPRTGQDLFELATLREVLRPPVFVRHFDQKNEKQLLKMEAKCPNSTNPVQVGDI